MTEEPDPKATPELTQAYPSWHNAGDEKLVESGDDTASDAATGIGRVPSDPDTQETIPPPPRTPEPLPASSSSDSSATVVGTAPQAAPQAPKPPTGKWPGENMTGKKIGGDYQLEKKIGQGGMGEVYKAKQVSLDRTVAVKCLPRTLATQPGFIDRFQREARSAAGIVHPNVIQMYASGVTEDGVPYFAMEFVEGEDLQQKLRKLGKLEIDDAVAKTLAVASALQAAHERGVIHRDVKPSNVMLDRNDNVRVMDFGLAKATQGGAELTQSGMIMGTPNYLSPEQGRGDPLDGRSDLYSLGVMFFELLTGSVPFRADTPAGLIFKHIYEPAPKPRDRNPDVPPFLEEICLKLLAKDPDERYKEAKLLVADLREFLDNRDHYYAGGARRPNAGIAAASSGRARAAGTSTGSMKAADPNRTAGLARDPSGDSASRARNAITEEVPRQQQQQQYAPPPPPPPQRSLVPFVIVLLLGGGAAAGLWKTGKLAEWGILPNPQPTGSGVFVPAGKEVVLSMSAKDLNGVKAKISSGVSIAITLEPDTPYRVPAGEYLLLAERRGYQTISARVVLDDDGAGENHARILLEATKKPYDLSTAWKANSDLEGAYKKGEEALAASNLAAALESFRKADDLDPAYSPEAGKPTAHDQLLSVQKQLGAKNAGLDEAKELRAKKKWRSLKKECEPHAGDPVWADLTQIAGSEFDKGEGKARELDDELSRGISDIAARIDELKANDPENDHLVALGEHKKRVESAHAAVEASKTASTEAQVDALKKYLAPDVAPQDANASGQLGKLQESTNRQKNEAVVGAAVNKLIDGHDWAKAREALDALKKQDPQSPLVTSSLTRIENGEWSDKATVQVDSLDRALSEILDKPQGADALLAQSPEMKKELDALHDLKAAGARIISSKHTNPQVTVQKNSDGSRTAEVKATWEVEVEVEGEHQKLALQHTISLRSEKDEEWKFTRFAATR